MAAGRTDGEPVATVRKITDVVDAGTTTKFTAFQVSSDPARFARFAVEAIAKSSPAWSRFHDLRTNLPDSLLLLKPASLEVIASTCGRIEHLREAAEATVKQLTMKVAKLPKMVGKCFSDVDADAKRDGVTNLVGEVAQLLFGGDDTAPPGGAPTRRDVSGSDLKTLQAWASCEFEAFQALQKALLASFPLYEDAAEFEERLSISVVRNDIDYVTTAEEVDAGGFQIVIRHFTKLLARCCYLRELARWAPSRLVMPLTMLRVFRNLESHCFEYAFESHDSNRKSLWKCATSCIATTAAIAAKDIPDAELQIAAVKGVLGHRLYKSLATGDPIDGDAGVRELRPYVLDYTDADFIEVPMDVVINDDKLWERWGSREDHYPPDEALVGSFPWNEACIMWNPFLKFSLAAYINFLDGQSGQRSSLTTLSVLTSGDTIYEWAKRAIPADLAARKAKGRELTTASLTAASARRQAFEQALIAAGACLTAERAGRQAEAARERLAAIA